MDDLSEEMALAIERRVVNTIGYGNLTNIKRGLHDPIEASKVRALIDLNRMKTLGEWLKETNYELDGLLLYLRVFNNLYEIATKGWEADSERFIANFIVAR